MIKTNNMLFHLQTHIIYLLLLILINIIKKDSLQGIREKYCFFIIQEIAPMSYIDLEARKTPGPGTYEEFRYN